MLLRARAHLPAVVDDEEARLQAARLEAGQPLCDAARGHGGVESIPGAPAEQVQGGCTAQDNKHHKHRSKHVLVPITLATSSFFVHLQSDMKA